MYEYLQLDFNEIKYVETKKFCTLKSPIIPILKEHILLQEY